MAYESEKTETDKLWLRGLACRSYDLFLGIMGLETRSEGTVRIFRGGRFGILIALLLFGGLFASCAIRSAQSYVHFSTPTPLRDQETLILGFMGGRDSWHNTEVGVGRMAQRMRDHRLPGVHVETVENRKRDLAVRLVRESLDLDGDGRLQKAESSNARIIIYGQSFGGAAVVKFARQLHALRIPVLLTVQVDSVGLNDSEIPPNVLRAANLYQDNGWLIRGEAPIRAQNPERTEILGNFRFDYEGSDIDLSHLPWHKTIGRVAHARMARDPVVWRKVEELMRGVL